MSTETASPVLPAHLEQAPTLETEPADKATTATGHRLRPLHLAYLDGKQREAEAVILGAQRAVAADFGVYGPFEIRKTADGGFEILAL